jgi:hypothetical protein
MAVLNREGFQEKAKRKYKTMQVKALDGAEVQLQSLTQAEYILHLERVAATPKAAASTEKYGFQVLFPSILTSGVIDDDRQPVFTGTDDPLFAELGPAAMAEIGDELLAFWGLDKLAPPAAQLKNSDAAPTESALSS